MPLNSSYSRDRRSLTKIWPNPNSGRIVRMGWSNHSGRIRIVWPNRPNGMAESEQDGRIRNIFGRITTTESEWYGRVNMTESENTLAESPWPNPNGMAESTLPNQRILWPNHHGRIRMV